MNKLFHFVKKEILHILRDSRTILVVFGLPLIQVMIFGYAIRNEVEHVDIMFFDQSKDQTTERLKNKIVSTDNFDYAGSVYNIVDAESTFKNGNAKVVLVLGQNFERNLRNGKGADIQILLDASDPNSATTINNYLTAIIGSFQKELSSGEQMQYTIIPEVRMLYNESLASAKLFVPGILGVILLIVSAMITSISLTKEKELGTMEILLASPLKPWMIIVGKLLPYIVISFINACVILFIGYVVFDVAVKGSLLLLFGESLLYVLVSLALGTLISITSESQQVALMKSLFALMMPSILLSGYIFPIENMPKALQYISTIMPARWYIDIIRSIMLKGVGLEVLWKQTLILATMAFVLISISIKKFKIRLEP
ncbi:ABC transporter permease [Aureibacter tunicatorum]|uniref:Transport permease protein n=1 Tax=Aureibacter tunicatorum TaxID=866807 RepID=A0AAE3XKC0_9BACT|nr:ABC transporter permease [Aureibacter tunicatorum]MDR6237510.1 ABC-2 type transport system permease protein [Aureibacter tunicatorum]BDD02544.1 transport permease protein [Aureibacter tunicatorum]